MNKFIFQVGVLGFCVAAVIYGSSGASILDIVSRSFIVFVGIILAVATIIAVGGTMLENNKARETAERAAARDAQRKQQ